MSDRFSLDNKVALITGGAGLLGMQHAICLLKAGATVYLADNNIIKAEKVAKTLGSKCIPIFIDVSKEISVKKVSKKIITVEKKIDILINNAANNPAVTTKKNFFSETSLEKFKLSMWKKDIDVGLTGSFLASKYFGTLIAKNKKGGSIINISSDLGLIAPDQRIYSNNNIKPITYSVVKTGILGLNRYLSTYWPKKVRSNAVCFGGVLNKQNKSFLKKVNRLIPMGRMAFPGEYNGVISFLCSDDSSYLNGAVIPVDGGRTAW